MPRRDAITHMERTCPFVTLAVGLGLVQPTQVRRCLATPDSSFANAADLDAADELVRHQILTRYQADAILTTIGACAGSTARHDPLVLGGLQVLRRFASEPFTYRCRRPRDGRHCVVRVVASDEPADTLVERLQANLDRWTALRDVRVVVPSVAVDDAGVLLMRPWLEGTALSDLVAHGRTVTDSAAVEIMRQLCEIAATAAEQSLLHGNWRLSNVIVYLDATVRVLDAGLDLTRRPGAATGQSADPDLDCTAPERRSGGQAPDELSEVYSLGSMLYQLLTGQSPYRAGTSERLLQHQRLGRPRPAPQLDGGTSRELRGLILSTLAGDRGARPPSLSELSDRMNRLSQPGRSRRRSWNLGAATPTVGSGRASRSLARPALRAVAFVSAAALSVAGAAWLGRSHLLPRLAIRSQVDRADVQLPAATAAMVANAAGVIQVSGVWQTSEMLHEACRAAPPGSIIELSTAGPFRLDGLTLSKPVTIRGVSDVRPLFVAGPGVSLRVIADQVRLENIHFVRLRTPLKGETAGSAPAMLECASEQVQLVGCSFQSSGGTVDCAAVGWSGVNGTDPRLQVANCYFADMSEGVRVSRVGPYKVAFDNCTHVGPGPLIETSTSPGRALDAIDVSLTHVSVRGAPVLHHVMPDPYDRMLPLQVIARQSLLVPLTREQPLLRVTYQGRLPPAAMPRVTWSGETTLCPADAVVVEVHHADAANRPWIIRGVAQWERYWDSRSTGLRGAPIPFESAAPPDSPILRQAGAIGADATKHLAPLPITLDQLPQLLERVE